MNRAYYIILLFVFALLPACGDLGELGEGMAATRDAARPTSIVVVADKGGAASASVDPEPLIIELAKPTLSDVVFDYAEISRSAQVLQSAEFNQLLLPDQQYTIFVPSDAAFAANSDLLADALLNDIGPQSMWRYLVVPQTVWSAQFSETSLSTLHGSPLPITLTSGMPVVANANVILSDIEFDRGVIHVIDRTVLPQ